MKIWVIWYIRKWYNTRCCANKATYKWHKLCSAAVSLHANDRIARLAKTGRFYGQPDVAAVQLFCSCCAHNELADVERFFERELAFQEQQIEHIKMLFAAELISCPFVCITNAGLVAYTPLRRSANMVTPIVRNICNVATSMFETVYKSYDSY